MQETFNHQANLQKGSIPRRPALLNRRTGWWLFITGAVLWSLFQADLFQRDLVNPGGWVQVQRFLLAAVQPDLAPDFLALTLNATLVTLAYAVCSTALSLLLGLVGGILASEIWWQAVFPTPNAQGWRHLCWGAVRASIAIPRAIHEIIWGLFFVNILGLDPLTAILAIAIPYGAIVAKVFSEILDETPRPALKALLNSGVSPLKAFLYSLIPQAFPDLLSYAFYRFECSIRGAAVLGIIGAGGLGYEIFLSLQALNYDQMWTLFYALILLNGLIDGWSSLLRHRFSNASAMELNLAREIPRRQLTAPRYRRDLLVKISLLILAILLPASFIYLQVDFSKLWSPRTVQLLGGVIQDSFPPRLDWVQTGELLRLSGQTLAMSILAMVVAGLGGILLSFPAARNFLLPGGMLRTGHPHWGRRWWGWTLFGLTRLFLLLCRSIPAPIWALIILFVLFPGILPGAIALGIYTLGILGRLMAEGVENLDRRPLRALQAQGASGPQVFLYGALPRTLPGFLAYIFYRWEVSIRETVIVGLVGAGGLGRLLTQQLSSFDYRAVVATLIFFLGLTFLVDILSTRMRRALR